MEKRVVVCPACAFETEWRYEVQMCISCGHRFSNWFLAVVRWIWREAWSYSSRMTGRWWKWPPTNIFASARRSKQRRRTTAASWRWCTKPSPWISSWGSRRNRTRFINGGENVNANRQTVPVARGTHPWPSCVMSSLQSCGTGHRRRYYTWHAQGGGPLHHLRPLRIHPGRRPAERAPAKGEEMRGNHDVLLGSLMLLFYLSHVWFLWWLTKAPRR